MTEIDREHPDYKRQKLMWRTYRDLYVGGHEFKTHASDYLLRRQKEPLDVYSERLHRVFYENYIGSIIDWYAATLFRREPTVHVEQGLDSGRRFLAEFSDDCDRRGTKLSAFFRQRLIEALISGASHILLDFPRASKVPQNRAEEDTEGISRAFLVPFEAEDLINWSCDPRGDYEWVVLRRKTRRQPSIDSSEIIEETLWYYYDKYRYRTYRRIEGGEHAQTIELVSQGSHCLARAGRVPLITLKFSDGLWLMNKAANLQLEHFNKSNALGWAITMGLFAMPVIYSDREWNQIVGESYFIQLGPNDKFGWTEPDGKVYQIAAENLQSLKEEIYRVCYLSQASGEMASGHAQSALSKQLDFAITQEVLRGYGALVKETINAVIHAISEARQDGLVVSVSGLDELDISDFGTELQQAAALLQVGISSPTLKGQIFERLAFKYLSDARQETKDQVAHEIRAQLKN
ncbi:MAG TPA: hypothetical protein VH601_20480 [Bryobacteraceae bacterium]|jgi:hypothetical protein